MTDYRFPSDELKTVAPGHSALVNRLLILRNVEDVEDFLSPNYETQLHNPLLLHDMLVAVARIRAAMENNERIAIFSDYDCDGIPGAVLKNSSVRKFY